MAEAVESIEKLFQDRDRRIAVVQALYNQVYAFYQKKRCYECGEQIDGPFTLELVTPRVYHTSHPPNPFPTDGPLEMSLPNGYRDGKLDSNSVVTSLQLTKEGLIGRDGDCIFDPCLLKCRKIVRDQKGYRYLKQWKHYLQALISKLQPPKVIIEAEEKK